MRRVQDVAQPRQYQATTSHQRRWMATTPTHTGSHIIIDENRLTNYLTPSKNYLPLFRIGGHSIFYLQMTVEIFDD